MIPLEFRNHTPFPAQAFQGVAPDGEPFHVAVLRQTCTWAGGALALDDAQSPLADTDRFAGAPNRSSVLAESDLCPFKPRCDLLLDAVAHAPGGRPARTFPVRFQVQGRGGPVLDKTLQVSGPGWFRRSRALVRLSWFLVQLATLGLVRRSPWRRTRPGPIRSLPLRYEHAYGGEAKVLISDRVAARVNRRHWLPGVTRKDLRAAFRAGGEPGALAWTVHDPNPVGQGFARSWHLRATRARTVPAPQIEAPGAPVTVRRFLRALADRDPDHPAYQPQGFGILAKAWAPRRRHLGTVDAAWVQGGRPLPEDFAFAYWNAAPPDQQVPHLEGDETLILTNLCAPDAPGAARDAQGHTILRLDLPGHLPFLLAREEEGALVPTPMALDTVSLDVEQARLVLVWRGALALEPAIRVLEARMLDRDEKRRWLEARPGTPAAGPGPALAGAVHG
jgi:hypothetical protein